MLENLVNNPTRWSLIRGILEAIIVAALLWIGNNLVAARQQNVILSYKLDTVISNTADYSAYKIRTAENTVEIRQLREEVTELRRLKAMR